jgi:transketolase
MATRGGCFVGASLSCTDLLILLYKRILRISKDKLRDPDRDYLFLSKGHDVPALYGTLAELCFFERDLLSHHLSTDADIYWHPNRNVPGVEFHSGSLGHVLSVAMGVALDIKLKGRPNRVFVILGDGELDEGSIWEGLLVAAAFDLDNLVLVVDRNGFQAKVRTEELIPLEPLDQKFGAFGFKVDIADGHSFRDLDAVFGRGIGTGRPRAIIANTVRGKGVPSLENRADRWFCNFTSREVDSLIGELHGERAAVIDSPALVVR